MGQIYPEILNLCEVRKFCDDPASRSANWDQVNQLLYQCQRNLSNSKISLKLIEYFVYLVPVCGPGSWVITKFSYFTQIEDFRKQAGAELGQAQPELGLEDRVFMLWFEL